MNAILTVTGALGLALLAGCASAPPLAKADVEGRIVCDSDRMARAERQAWRSGGTVVWVNCPEATLRVI